MRVEEKAYYESNVHWECEGHLELATRGTTSISSSVLFPKVRDLLVTGCKAQLLHEQRKSVWADLRYLCHLKGRSLRLVIWSKMDISGSSRLSSQKDFVDGKP
jgi:hypothetical protein